MLDFFSRVPCILLGGVRGVGVWGWPGIYRAQAVGLICVFLRPILCRQAVGRPDGGEILARALHMANVDIFTCP
jgi:hypothetical protein